MKHESRQQAFKRVLKRVFKVSVFVLLMLSFYLIYLDAWVQNKMAGPKWQTPVSIYARPLLLYPFVHQPRHEVIKELEMLNYVKAESVRQPGQYRIDQQTLEIYIRSFIAESGTQPPRHVRITFNDSVIDSVQIREQQNWQAADSIQLEPLLISRQTDEDNEDREIINLATMPEWMIDTLLLVEDRDFYHHHGVSPLAMIRALFVNLSAGRKVQGGSTLTQQLAKNLLLNDNSKTYWRKFNEALVAVILDYRFSKDDILEAYINEIYMGQNGSKGVHGFALASQFYFAKPLVELSAADFALLVAIVKGPSYYNPRRHAERALARRDLILQLMASSNILSRNEYEFFVAQPLQVKEFERVKTRRFGDYIEQVERELEALDLELARESGIKVFTGLDPVLQSGYQKIAEQQINRLQKRHKIKELNGAIVSVAVDSGAIIAIVGDKESNRSGFNRALNAQRNIGSLIKPAIYLTALQQPNYHLASPISNETLTLQNNQGKTWTPKNFDGKQSQSVWLTDGLSQSLNLATVRLGMALGLDDVITTLRKLGIQQDIPRYPSMLLGAISMSPLDVAKWYAPIASFGIQYPVSAIRTVTDNNGIALWQVPTSGKPLIEYEVAYQLNHALHAVTQEGTASRLGRYYPNVRYAGKTGTTDDERDSWFAGFDQKRLTTVWLGSDDNEPIDMTGSQGALTLFIELQAAKQAQSIQVPMPNQVELGYFDVKTAQRLDDDCGEVRMLPVGRDKQVQVQPCPSLFDFFK